MHILSVPELGALNIDCQAKTDVRENQAMWCKGQAGQLSGQLTTQVWVSCSWMPVPQIHNKHMKLKGYYRIILAMKGEQIQLVSYINTLKAVVCNDFFVIFAKIVIMIWQ